MKNYQNGCLDDFSTGRRVLRGDNVFKSNSKLVLFHDLKFDSGKFRGVHVCKRHISIRKHLRNIALMLVFMVFFVMLRSCIVSIFDYNLQDSPNPTSREENGLQKEDDADIKEEKLPVHMYGRLLNLASTALSEKEFKQQDSNLLEEHNEASAWKPCADRLGPFLGKEGKTNNGYMMVSANGGLNQQRVAICNAVAVAFLLNATLVIPTFLYSNVWKDPSQFGDIYQEEYFMNIMKDEVNIVKELPPHLKSLDIEAIGSLITDADIVKEAKPIDYIEKILPVLKRNGLVHFLGFGNRLGFDPLPENLQRLRCKCNFHALKFSPKIQEIGSLLVRRIRKFESRKNMLDQQLLGKFMPDQADVAEKSSYGYLALHLRFEEDMVAYSLCDFGGGENERKELHTYRESHFPLLIERLKKYKPISSEELRKLGKCPLTPEESALVLASLGIKQGTYIYLAGSQIYGGWSRMQPFASLYPNLITKETLLSPRELEPFRNFSSQLAALDFIACATADVFAMTDSGSQLSSLVSGFRTYYGGGRAPTLSPNKKRLAAILSENRTIEWSSFEDRIEKMIEEGRRVRERGFGRSIYRQPRSPGCMCKSYPNPQILDV